MLSTNVKTIDDLMSIAIQAEREAVRRYTELAEKMRQGNNPSAAALFERMVKEEREHERLLQKWIKKENIKENPDIGPISWNTPQVSTTYNDDACDPGYSTPYRALAFAVHNEEIAFHFYTHVAANSENDAVRRYAEILAHEELGHASLLRAERRIAFHQESTENTTEPRLDHHAVHQEADLLAAAIHIDRYLLEQINSLNTHSPQISELANESEQQIIKNNNLLTTSGDLTPGDDILNNLQQLKSYHAKIKPELDTPEHSLQRLWACCDRSFAFYDAIVETAENENIMLSAQELSADALDRIGVLKQVFGDIDTA